MLRVSLMAFGSGLTRRTPNACKGSAASAVVANTKSAGGRRTGVRRNTRVATETKKNGHVEVDGETPSAPTPSLSRKRGGDAKPVNTNMVHASGGGFRSRHSEEEVLQLAQRMQRRDLTGDVPVASFAYEVLKVHPSVRQMGLRERMGFLCDRWERLSKKQRQAYLDDPLKGLL